MRLSSCDDGLRCRAGSYTLVLGLMRCAVRIEARVLTLYQRSRYEHAHVAVFVPYRFF